MPATEDDTAVPVKTGTVYALIDPRYDVVRYIGQTRQSLAARLAGHLSTQRRNPELKAWITELTSAGIRPIIRGLLAVPTEDLIKAEKAAIEEHTRQGWPLLNIIGVPHVDPVELASARLDRARRRPWADRDAAERTYRAARDQELAKSAKETAWGVLAAVAREVVGGPLPPPALPAPPYVMGRLAIDYLASDESGTYYERGCARERSTGEFYEALRASGLERVGDIGFRDLAEAIYLSGWSNPADVIRVAHLATWLREHVAPWHNLALRAGLPAKGAHFAEWISDREEVRAALALVDRSPCRNSVYMLLMDGTLDRGRFDPCAEYLATYAAAHAPAHLLPVAVSAGRDAGLVDALYDRSWRGILDEPTRDFLVRMDPNAEEIGNGYNGGDYRAVAKARKVMDAQGYPPETLAHVVKALYDAVGPHNGGPLGRAVLGLMLGVGEIPARKQVSFYDPLGSRLQAIAEAMGDSESAAA